MKEARRQIEAWEQGLGSEAASQRLALLQAGTRAEDVQAAQQRTIQAEKVAAVARLGTRPEELAQARARVDQAQAEVAQISVQLGDPEIYKDGGAKAAALQKRLHAAEAEHAEALSRWMDLDARKDG